MPEATYFRPGSEVLLKGTDEHYRTSKKDSPKDGIYTLITLQGDEVIRKFKHEELELVAPPVVPFIFCWM